MTTAHSIAMPTGPTHWRMARQVLARQLQNPLLRILAVTTIVLFLLGEHGNVVTIILMMVISIALGFWTEYRAERTMADLQKRIAFNAIVRRDGEKISIPVPDLRMEDLVLLLPGMIIPADIRLTEADSLQIDESSLTGESFPARKSIGSNCSMGTVVLSGTGVGTIRALGSATRFGQLARTLEFSQPETSFQRGLRDFGNLIVHVITVLAVVIFAVNALLRHPIIDSALFALTIAIGLTPELLPVIVTVSLAQGARRLARHGVLAKQLTAIEDLGNMDILCTDKTGTLTEGVLQLHDLYDGAGTSSPELLGLALTANTAVVHHRVFGSAIDVAVWEHARMVGVPTIPKKIAEQAFDFEKRLTFAVTSQHRLIAHGAPESIIASCQATAQKKHQLLKKFETWSAQGYRVTAIASRPIQSKRGYSFDDVQRLHFDGFVLFSDPPKLHDRAVLARLSALGVSLKILTGDNEIVTRAVCSEIGFPCKVVLTGTELHQLSEAALEKKLPQVDAFVRVSPEQKLRVLRALKRIGHTVGYIGDGINDAPSLHEADVGISVDSGVDVAKDSASIVLTRKSLAVVIDGIEQGRRTFANTMKYILMGTSSNFGNMFSAAGASFLLPFLPMAPTQILLTNSLYDLSQLSIPTDHVDEEQLVRPDRWDVHRIKRYMIFFGPLSSAYDFLTFGILYFGFHARGSFFQTGWFLESLLTEILVVFVIRTRRVPFFTSKPGPLLVISSLSVIVIGSVLPFSPLASTFSFVPVPLAFGFTISALTITYLFLVDLAKRRVLTPNKI